MDTNEPLFDFFNGENLKVPIDGADGSVRDESVFSTFSSPPRIPLCAICWKQSPTIPHFLEHMNKHYSAQMRNHYYQQSRHEEMRRSQRISSAARNSPLNDAEETSGASGGEGGRTGGRSREERIPFAGDARSSRMRFATDSGMNRRETSGYVPDFPDDIPNFYDADSDAAGILAGIPGAGAPPPGNDEPTNFFTEEEPQSWTMMDDNDEEFFGTSRLRTFGSDNGSDTNFDVRDKISMKLDVEEEEEEAQLGW
eukprot:TRINITY_DN6940_c0_g1_i1.p1 TRINITY_DN6940_c0_g1~~TRINITY_DN6940_c0_g1_i1.p1  ORF type:complete len:254 (-),score=55.89 TRINITY_DN6940_c0_g1_i1:229-990(-)